jgi:signal transduction histidine kinase
MNDATSDESLEAARAMDEVDAVRRRVVNVVGHALRTPVTTLCGMAEALAVAEDPTTRAAMAEGVVRNARLVERLLDQLLIASGVSTALPVGDAKTIDVLGAIHSAWDQLGSSGSLSVDASDTDVRARPAAVEQILSLVLDNAVKYGDGEVVVTAVSAGGKTVIEVQSRGGDPSDEEVEQAFELFYRGEHAVMRTAGMGVGLPVARTLARLEGGDVTLFRREGTVVTKIELPT